MDSLLGIKTTEEAILANAGNVIKELSIRLAHRIEALRQLDYLILLIPSISQIYSTYFTSFQVMNSAKPPTTLEENDEFVKDLEKLVEAHTNSIPTLAKGFYEARKILPAHKSGPILDTHLRARIGTRLIGEHHISLSHPNGSSFHGAVQTDCKPSTILNHCAEFVGDICDIKYGIVPKIMIDQGENISLPYVPVHMEYIFTELLKNSARATIEKLYDENGRLPASANPLPIWVTIIKTGHGVMIRIRDRGGGIPPEVKDDIFNFAFSTFEEQEGDGFATLNSPPGGSSIAGLGYGLPLSRAYAEFFGGRLDIQSYYGWGTDVYLTLNGPVEHNQSRA